MSTDEVRFLETALDKAIAATKRVRHLHKPVESRQWVHGSDCPHRETQWVWRQGWQCKPECTSRTVLECHGCPYHPDYGMERWPCETIKALDGEQG